MATFRYVHVDHPAGLRLLDLYGVEVDLTRCQEMCGIIQIRQIRQPEYYEIDALAVAIPTIYGRVFLGGVRNEAKLPAETIFGPNELKFHNEVLNLRSKYVVHSINAMERPRLRVWLNPEERGGRRINGVDADLTNVLTLGPRHYQDIHALCSKARGWVSEQMTIERANLKAIVERDFTLDQLYSKDAEVATSGDMDTVAKGRSR